MVVVHWLVTNCLEARAVGLCFSFHTEALVQHQDVDVSKESTAGELLGWIEQNHKIGTCDMREHIIALC